MINDKYNPKQELINFERLTLEKTMEYCKYNQVKAAELLGISRGALRSKLEKHFTKRSIYFKQTICENAEEFGNGKLFGKYKISIR